MTSSESGQLYVIKPKPIGMRVSARRRRYVGSIAVMADFLMKFCKEAKMAKDLNKFERQLCDIQGRFFERSHTMNLDSMDFIEKFMHSKTCEYLDMSYDRLQWAGEEYLLDNLSDEIPVRQAGARFSKEVLFWIGYVYRYWHLMTGESSSVIYTQAKAQRMNACYQGFHTLDVTMAIEDLKEINKQECT